MGKRWWDGLGDNPFKKISCMMVIIEIYMLPVILQILYLEYLVKDYKSLTHTGIVAYQMVKLLLLSIVIKSISF